jgi:hypothetical protein
MASLWRHGLTSQPLTRSPVRDPKVRPTETGLFFGMLNSVEVGVFCWSFSSRRAASTHPSAASWCTEFRIAALVGWPSAQSAWAV